MTCDRRAFVAALAGLGLPAAGCSGPDRVRVSGRVTLDGADLEDGQILFEPADPGKGAEAGRVENGRFEVAVRPGHHRVKVTAARELPRKGEFRYFEEVVPDRYNQKTELTLDVPASGVADTVFALTGGRKK